MTTLDLDNLDVVFVLDMSGSMADPYKNGMSKWKAAEESGTALANEMSAHDDDGITAVVFNNTFSLYDGVTGSTIGDLFKKHTPNGGTDLAPPLRAVINQFVRQRSVVATAKSAVGGFLSSLFGGSEATTTTAVATNPLIKGKPVCIVVLTDGAANDKDEVIKVIVDATTRINDRKELGILFIQVGSDPDAERFLQQVDSELAGAGALHDIVARVKLEDVEDLTTVELLTKAYTA